MASPEEKTLKTSDNLNLETKKKSFKDKLVYIKQNITVEPVLACYVVPGALARLATQNLNLDKACRVNKNYGEQVCSALIAREGNKYLKEELAVQELIAAMESWKNVLLTAIPSLLILFLGAWSDRTGKRKICIVLPIIGDFLMCLSNIVNAYFFYELPVEVTMFFEAFFPAITGGWIATYMGAFSYIGDVSSKESRTFRVGIANLCLTAGSPIGSVLSGVLLKHIGYYGVFSICSLLYLFSIVYGFYYIEDPQRPDENKKDSPGVCGFLKSFFDGKHVKDTLQVAFKKGPNRRRTKSILILATIAFIYGPAYGTWFLLYFIASFSRFGYICLGKGDYFIVMPDRTAKCGKWYTLVNKSGEYTVRYLFTRYRFNWDALKYSFYGTFHILTHCLGALISISLFSHRLKWDDSVLGIISMCSKLVGTLATAFARNTTEMYIAVAVETFNATSFTALRSISSKLCTSDELGKMISVFNLMEVLTSMVFGPIYSWIYMFTLKTDAGFMYYVSAVLTLPALSIYIWFFAQHRKSIRRNQKQNVAENQENLVLHKNIRKDDLLSSIDLADEKII